MTAPRASLARLTFRPVGDTPALYFTTIDIAREEAGAITAFDRAFVQRGDADIRVPTGTYDVWISHGPEWDTWRERVTIKPGAEVELHARLHHVIDTPGWISGSQLTVLGPGNTVRATRAIPSSTGTVRFDDTIELDVARDGYAIVRVDGDRPMAPNVGDLKSFLVYPVAVANPIWIDTDGDGKIASAAPYSR